MKRKTFTTDSPEATMAIASGLARDLGGGDFIALEGELGSGKTVFVKGLAGGLGVKDHLHVNSPTFVIMKEYSGRCSLYHFDVYRLDERHFVDTVDYARYFDSNGITVVEWADKIKDTFPKEYLEIIMEYVLTPISRIDKVTFRAAGISGCECPAEAGEAVLTSRSIEFIAHGDKYERIIEKMSPVKDTRRSAF